MKQKTQSEVTVNESKHTPGKWEYDSIRCEIRGGLKTKGMPLGINKIATVNQGGLNNPGGDAKANARLIAAAPDLLDASQSVLTTLEAMVKNDMIEGMIWVLQMAIDKATNSK